MEKATEDYIQKELTIITFTGKTLKIDYFPFMTVGEVKQIIIAMDATVSDFDFLYAGRKISSNDKLLEEFIHQTNMTLYTNAKGVHGGCYKIDQVGKYSQQCG